MIPRQQAMPAHLPDHIVHPTDLSAESEASFAHALRLALAARGHLALVHAGEAGGDGKADWGDLPGVRSTLRRWGLLAEGAPRSALDEERLGLEVVKAQLAGTSAERALARFLETSPCDLLVLATHARDGLARLLHGSVAETLARQVRAPSLLLPLGAAGFVDPGSGTAQLRSILVPVDPAMPAAAAAAAALALRLADGLGCTEAVAHLLHVGPPEAMLAVSMALDDQPRLRHLRADGHQVVEAILAAAARLDAGLIVMVTHGHDSLLDMLRGSTTEQVLRRAGRAVLSVPAGTGEEGEEESPLDYSEELLAQAQLLWGPGFISPGGAEEVARIVNGVDLAGKEVLEIGVGLAGPACLLVERHGAARVVGIDLQAHVLARAAALVQERGLAGRVVLQRVEPGPLPFADASFDAVFSKEAIVHIRDKAALLAETHRVLRPGGWLLVGDWFAGSRLFARLMRRWSFAARATLRMALLDEQAALLAQAGFTEIAVLDRSDWYREVAQQDAARLRTDERARIEAALGAAGAESLIRRVELTALAVARGQLRPGHLRARKPA